jgi:hypothetical protein
MVREHGSPDVSVAQSLVATQLMQVNLDRRWTAIKANLAGQCGCAHLGVVGQRNQSQLLANLECSPGFSVTTKVIPS